MFKFIIKTSKLFMQLLHH